jgi:hypothetical protein
MAPEIIYAAFTFIAGSMVWMHLDKIMRDKRVHGMHWGPVLFSWFWCAFAVYFYAVQDLWWCWWANLWMLFNYTLWLAEK